MTYRDDLQAALSRTDALERELAVAREEVRAELGRRQAEREQLQAELAALRREKWVLPRAAVQRLLIGLALFGLTIFDVVASWGAPAGVPPNLGLEAGPVAAVGAVIAAAVISARGPHRALALGVLATTGALLTAKPYLAPVLSTWQGTTHRYGTTSETHLYFLLSGLAALFVAAVMLLDSAKTPVKA